MCLTRIEFRSTMCDTPWTLHPHSQELAGSLFKLQNKFPHALPAGHELLGQDMRAMLSRFDQVRLPSVEMNGEGRSLQIPATIAISILGHMQW